MGIIMTADARASRSRSATSCPRTETADRPGRDLDDPGAALVPAQLRVNGTVGEPERASPSRRLLLDLRLDIAREPGRRHVDRLLEERAFERVGLVEERERAEPSGRQEALERYLDSGDEVLYENVTGL